MEEEMRMLNITEDWQRTEKKINSGGNSYQVKPQERKLGILNEGDEDDMLLKQREYRIIKYLNGYFEVYKGINLHLFPLLGCSQL